MLQVVDREYKVWAAIHDSMRRLNEALYEMGSGLAFQRAIRSMRDLATAYCRQEQIEEASCASLGLIELWSWRQVEEA